MRPFTFRYAARGRYLFLVAALAAQSSVAAYSSNSNADEPPVITDSTEPPASQPKHHIVSADAKNLGVGQNIGFVELLINQSAAAKQILESDNAEAKALRQQAIQHLEEAKQAQAVGDSAAVGVAIGKAKTAIFQAIRLSGDKVVKDKRESDYKNRVQSVSALLEAHKRVSAEKGGGDAAKEVEQHVTNELQKAQTEFDQGQIEKANELANAAYLTIKLSVTRLRDGDRLVRELHFATKEDEYKYELERNNTHKILVNVVLKEKISVQMSLLMKIPMGKAEELRQAAEGQAASGDYDGAIETLEKSTQQIIRAIRMAGVFIPG